MTQNQIFEDVIMVIVVISIGFMLLVHADMAPTFSYIVSYSNLAFTIVFLIEMLLKWIALDVHGYFKSGWNCFDFTVRQRMERGWVRCGGVRICRERFTCMLVRT